MSEFLDGTIEPSARVEFSAHLSECAACAAVRDELSSIVSFCRTHRGEYEEVPQERAMWLRISNVVENERRAEGRREATPIKARPAGGGSSIWSGLLNKRWELSLPQLAATVAAVIIVVSTMTAAGLRLSQGPEGPPAAIDPLPPLTRRNYDDVMRRQQMAINYWNQRVEERKSRWSPQMREAFDRNMRTLDLTVDDALAGLKSNPHDDVAEEMLNAAISDKMELLKEFSEL